MSQATLTSRGENQFAVSGNMNFATVPELLSQSERLFSAASAIDIDLSAVLHADSAGLALLLEWLRYGKHNSKSVHYRNVPAQLRLLAAISEVESLLEG
ncbi:MAG TPA: STAS domain-containing protein [Steroidobacteraceae bacterium]|nr:STAS domain-containing protein [Steroidobacteraceae bacterium]